MFFVNKIDYSNIDLSKGSGLALEFADETNLDWESKFISMGLKESKDDLKILMLTPRSFDDISEKTVFFDAKFVIAGYSVMIIFTILILGKFTVLEIRLYLTISGIVSIIMGMVVGVGISCALGYPYTTINIMLPFICLGIGIDDMFVIAQCWSNMNNDPANALLSLPQKMGLTLKHAGVSITITTVTDVFAFGIGAASKMPGLQSFCVCTAVSLGAIYLLQITWFVAWMSLDQDRIQSNRSGLVPCITLQNNNNEPVSCFSLGSGKSLLQKYVDHLLPSTLFKILVLATVCIFTTLGICGCVLIKQKFDFLLLLPKESYLRQWKDMKNDLYPDKGWVADIYTDSFNFKDLHKFENLTNSLEELRQSGDCIQGYESWWSELKKYSIEKENFSNWEQIANNEVFPTAMSNFLYSSSGAKFQENFKFSGNITCGQPVPQIKSSRFKIQYLHFSGPEEHIPAKRKIDDIIKKSGVPGGFSFVKVYATWEMDEIITEEMNRNIGLSLACITIITLVMLANFTVCFMVLIIVILTLIDIIGFLHFWNITIDIFSASGAVLSIGLCVDYAVHLGLAYIIQKGSRLEKSAGALTSIGSAIFNR